MKHSAVNLGSDNTCFGQKHLFNVYRGVIRTLSNIYDRAFLPKQSAGYSR